MFLSFAFFAEPAVGLWLLQPLCRIVALSPCRLVALSPCRFVALSPCGLVALWRAQSATLTHLLLTCCGLLLYQIQQAEAAGAPPSLYRVHGLRRSHHRRNPLSDPAQSTPLSPRVDELLKLPSHPFRRESGTSAGPGNATGGERVAERFGVAATGGVGERSARHSYSYGSTSLYPGVGVGERDAANATSTGAGVTLTRGESFPGELMPRAGAGQVCSLRVLRRASASPAPASVTEHAAAQDGVRVRVWQVRDGTRRPAQQPSRPASAAGRRSPTDVLFGGLLPADQFLGPGVASAYGPPRYGPSGPRPSVPAQDRDHVGGAAPLERPLSSGGGVSAGAFPGGMWDSERSLSRQKGAQNLNLTERDTASVTTSQGRVVAQRIMAVREREAQSGGSEKRRVAAAGRSEMSTTTAGN